MVTLYYAPGACSLSVHIVLEWIGEPYDAKAVDPHDPAYRKINPAGAVPALDYGGPEPLTQNAAIHRYLGLTHPEADLLDDSTPERAARLERWSAFLTGDLHPAFFPLFVPGRYTVSKDADVLDSVKQAAVSLVQSKLELFETDLGDQIWMTGKRTYADAYATPMLRWARMMIPGGLEAYPNLARHHDHMLADPGVRRAMAAEGLVKPET